MDIGYKYTINVICQFNNTFMTAAYIVLISNISSNYSDNCTLKKCLENILKNLNQVGYSNRHLNVSTLKLIINRF